MTRRSFTEIASSPKTLLAMTNDEDNDADETFSSGCSKSSAAGLRRERDMRRTLLYAAMTNDEDNNADGTF